MYHWAEIKARRGVCMVAWAWTHRGVIHACIAGHDRINARRGVCVCRWAGTQRSEACLTGHQREMKRGVLCMIGHGLTEGGVMHASLDMK